MGCYFEVPPSYEDPENRKTETKSLRHRRRSGDHQNVMTEEGRVSLADDGVGSGEVWGHLTALNIGLILISIYTGRTCESRKICSPRYGVLRLTKDALTRYSMITPRTAPPTLNHSVLEVHSAPIFRRRNLDFVVDSLRASAIH